MRNILKREAEKFINEIEKLLNSRDDIKQVESSSSMNEYVMNTCVGLLIINTEKWEHIKGGSVYSIYTCFKDSTRASEELPFEINAYTGKYNFHSFSDIECYCKFKEFLNIVSI